MHALDLIPTLTQLQNAAAWAVLVLLVSAALGGVWWATGRLLPPPRHRREDWRQWAEDRRQIEHAKRRRR